MPARRPRQPTWSTASAVPAPFCLRNRDGQAVGGDQHHREAGLVGPEGVPGRMVETGGHHAPVDGRLDDARAVLLPQHRRSFRIAPCLLTQEAAILDHMLRLVSRENAEVQRLERPVADAADAGRERNLVRAGRLPAKDRDHGASISLRAAASSDSRPSSSPFSLRRLNSESTSPTRGDSARPSSATSDPVISRRTSPSRSK